MDEDPPTGSGTVAWRDLTVPDADRIRRFYGEVVGWRSEPLEGDFNMFPRGSSEPVAGICYARGANARLPAVWLLYILVDDLGASLETAKRLGAQILDGPRSAGSGRIAVIQDPAGASVALFQRSSD